MLLDEDSIHMCLIYYKRSSKGVNAYLKRGVVVRSRLQTHVRSYSTYNTLIPSYGGYFVKASGDKSAPPKPPGLTYRWYKKDEFRALPEDHQEWLCYEKRCRDKESTAALKENKRKVKNLIRKEKRKLAKLKASNKEGKKADEKDNSSNESS
jgi:hypothetical protein